MVQINPPARPFSGVREQRALYPPAEPPVSSFPIQTIEIDWARLQAKRLRLLASDEAMPMYLLKPEILQLLYHEKDTTYRLVLDLMWSTGARISEVLALTPASFDFDGYEFTVRLKTLKQRPGRPSKASLQRSSTRFVPILDLRLQDQIQSYLYKGRFRKTDRIFTMSRHTVHRHIKRLVDELGGYDYPVSCHTFRHSFAVHLLLHGRPLKIISKLLGHRSTESTEIYTNVLTVDGGHFLEGVDFH